MLNYPNDALSRRHDSSGWTELIHHVKPLASNVVLQYRDDISVFVSVDQGPSIANKVRACDNLDLASYTVPELAFSKLLTDGSWL